MEPTTRRTAIKGGLAMAAGAVGLAGARTAEAAAARPVVNGKLTVAGRDAHALVERPFGEPARFGDRVTLSAELVDAVTGVAIGEFYGTSIATVTPGIVQLPLVSSVQNHVFQLADGTIAGSGTTLPGVADNEFAIVGGTGRYAGARGTYLARHDPLEFGGDGSASFTFTVITEARNGV